MISNSSLTTTPPTTSWTISAPPQAKASYGKYNQLEQSYKQLQEKLEDMRSEYSRANKQEKDKMSAAILDLEQRVRQLSTEMEQTAIQVRNLEKQATK